MGSIDINRLVNSATSARRRNAANGNHLLPSF
jgi:hypothetical protein